MAKTIRAIPKTMSVHFYDLASTVGGYIIFPANRINGQPSINGIRGIHPNIMDRFDLTLECIRRWDLSHESPLYERIERYRSFFLLFTDFKGYCDFFQLNDLVDGATGKIRFWLPFEDFSKTPPLPDNVEEYPEYRENVSEFVKARNRRMVQYIQE